MEANEEARDAFVTRTIADIGEMEEILQASLTYARYSSRDPSRLNFEDTNLAVRSFL